MTNPEILEQLKKVEGVFETYEVLSTFMFYRNDKNGSIQQVYVELHDAGPQKSNRYSFFAKSDDNKSATGNPDTSIDFALDNVHWEHLDFDE